MGNRVQVRRATKLHLSRRRSVVEVTPDDAWRVVAGAGPGQHWYIDALPLPLRGAVDRLLGGEGQRWPVPAHELLESGDRAGFWRVQRARGHRLDLEADVRAPGHVLLRTRVEAHAAGSTLTQEVVFEPDGLLGQLYMAADLPAREVVVELVHRQLLSELSG